MRPLFDLLSYKCYVGKCYVGKCYAGHVLRRGTNCAVSKVPGSSRYEMRPSRMT